MKTTLDLMTYSQLRDLWESGKHPYQGYAERVLAMMDDFDEQRRLMPPVVSEQVKRQLRAAVKDVEL